MSDTTGKSANAPSDAYITQALPDLFRHYSPRNKQIFESRRHAAGQNEILKPKNVRYTVQTLHMWNMRSYLNERLARFLPVPRIRVIADGISDTAVSAASDLEKSINALYYWTRRQNDDWGRAISDVMLFDGGATRWEANVKGAWPKLSVVDEDGEDEITRGMPTGKERDDYSDPEEAKKAIDAANRRRTKARDAYKIKQGVTRLFSRSYVPYEALFGFPDSDQFEEFIEIEFRSVRKIIDNELFDPAVRDRLKRQATKEAGYSSFRSMAPIVRYCNREVYAYYLLDHVSTADQTNESLLIQFLKAENGKDAFHLYSYDHGAGIPLYNHIGGMHGGWGSNDWGLTIGKNKALIDLNQAIDELASQAFSNVRETFWPTLVIKTDTERPITPLSDGDVRKIIPRGTEDLEMYKGEDVGPLFQAKDNPLYVDMMDRLKEQMAKIGGAPGLYGVHQPGIEGGFQENTLLQQADSQFARVEGNIVTAAQNDVHILLGLIRAMDETVFVRVRSKKDGRDYFEDLSIGPRQLDPMPEIDAVVKARVAGNEAVQLRNYISATTDVAGPGSAAMPRNMARQELLDMEQPDDVDVALMAQSVRDAVLPGILQTEVSNRYQLMAAQQAVQAMGPVDPSVMANDPDLAAQMGMYAEGQSPPPPPMPGTAGLGMQGVGGGLPYGGAQPEATAGISDAALMMPPPPAAPGMV